MSLSRLFIVGGRNTENQYLKNLVEEIKIEKKNLYLNLKRYKRKKGTFLISNKTRTTSNGTNRTKRNLMILVLDQIS